MLTRRDIRIKVLQAAYAFIQSENDRLDQGDRYLIGSIEKIHQLYIWQLGFIIEIFDFANKRIEENKQKLVPSQEDLDPNTRFIDNRIINILRENKDYKKFHDAYKVNYSIEPEMIRKFYMEFKRTEAYEEYMEASRSGYHEDREIVLEMLHKHIVNYDLLQSFFEEMDINWVDDFDTSLILIDKTIRGLKPNQDEFTRLPDLLKTNLEGEPEDKIFARNLFRKTIINIEKYDEIITTNASNWEFERIAKMDLLLLRLAICEFLEFPTIPVKVTINEYIDISKLFSSPKSRVFINGMLDKLASEFTEKEMMRKSGRGLIND